MIKWVLEHMPKQRIAFIGAGQPRFFERVINETLTGKLTAAVIALAIAEKPDSGVFEVAKRYDIPAFYIPGRDEVADLQMSSHLVTHDIDLAMLAGYRYLIGPHTLQTLPEKEFNYHPAPLYRFGGKGYYGPAATQKVLDAGVEYGGPTIHIINEEYDRGPILAHTPVKIEPGETAQSLLNRTNAVGRELYIDTVQQFLAGALAKNRHG